MKSATKKWAFFAATGLLLACGGRLATVHRGNPPIASTPPRVLPSRLDWVPGRRYEYRFSLMSSAKLGAGSSTDLDLSGRLSVVSRDVGPSVRELSVALDDLGSKARAAPNGAVQGLIGRLHQPFSITVDHGRAVSFRVAQGGDAEAANVLRTLTSALQCAESSSPGAAWTAEEYDSTGKYQAEYRVTDPAVGLFKRKLRYLSLTLGGPRISLLSETSPKPEITASEGNLALRDGTLQRVKIVDELVLSSQGVDVVSKTEISMELASAVPTGPVDWAELEEKTRPLAAQEPYVGPPRPASAFDAQRIGDFTFETALAALEKVGRAAPSVRRGTSAAPVDDAEEAEWVRESERAFVAMSAILRAEPVHLARAKKILQTGSAGADWIVDALASAGTDDAQAVLLGLLQEPHLKLERRVSVARSLIRTEQPSDAAVDWLIRSETDPVLGEMAVYGLGSAARRLGEARLSERATRATNELLRLLSAAANKHETVLALHGLCNSGDSRAFEPIRSMLDDPDPAIRAASVEALRLMQDPRVDGLIADRFGDASADVRLAALTAGKARAPSDVLARKVEGLMLRDEKTSVRGRAIRIAKMWLARRPDLRSALETVAERDGNESLRKAARDALGV